MSKYIGLEWAGKGWFGVVLEADGDWDVDLFPSILSVWKYHSDADRIFVTVPIGLPSSSRRACDVAARKRLRSRGRSVFYAPIRDAVYEQNLDAAKELNETAGYSIQNQAWSIVPRIREVDEFLDMYPSARDRLIETHPEVCFYALNGQAPLADPKTSEAGMSRRKELLAEQHDAASSILDHAIEQYTQPNYAPTVSSPDDILDALVAAVTAARDPDACSSLPRSPPTDERGLAMQIVYPSATEQTRLSSLG